MLTASSFQIDRQSEVARLIDDAPRLASLRSINTALAELVYAESSFTTQIAEVIRRDPSLTSRLLRMVNSVFFGLSERIHNIEDAIFYLGLRQIRELALATPVIEDFARLKQAHGEVDWHALWQHSMGAALLTRDIINNCHGSSQDDTEYIAGLVHNVGKIVIASVLPEAFTQIASFRGETVEEVSAFERELLGWDHAVLGAYYLEKHGIAGDIVDAVRYHNEPAVCPNPALATAVHLGDLYTRACGFDPIENLPAPSVEELNEHPLWEQLLNRQEKRRPLVLASLDHTLQRLPALLQNVV